MNSDSTQLHEILGYVFKDANLLSTALRHSSTTTNRTQSNERLEFLGDRVLGLTMAETLYLRFDDEDEGHLARRYAGLTSRVALARVADLIDLRQFIHIQTVDLETEKRSYSSITADTLEAIFGAMYLDGGLEPAQAFIAKHWENLISQDLSAPKDAKTALQEWAQARSLGLPIYSIASRDGPDHAPTFTMEVTVQDQAPQSASGTSRRSAEQSAAQKLLTTLENT
ncbi:MAG: ribonuclease III [Rhodospirillaceae bacterium]|nr:MAG: ribonuclease III [Rhodospirillaceae bacterium]